jgi:hypothetical protein
MKTATRTNLVLGAASLLMLSACNKTSTTAPSAGGSGGPGIGFAGGVELKIDIPKETISGTPRPRIKLPNLMPEIKKFPKFLVPENTLLLSKGKKVTSSDDLPILGELSCITDGDKENGEGHFVELAEGTQWVQIDLEKSNSLYAILVWHFHNLKRAYHDVIVQVSDDPEFKTDVTTLFNNDYDNSSKLGKGISRPYIETRYGLLVNPKGIEGRYVRLYSRGSTVTGFNHYIEVEVYGKPE